MIGSGLIRFHPHTQRPQDGYGLTDTAWKTLKEAGPTLLRDVITAAATEGVKGLKTGVKGVKLIGWVDSLRPNKELNEKPNKNSLNLSRKKPVKVFLVSKNMIPIYSRRVHRIPYSRRTYKRGTILATRSNLPDYRWIQSAFEARLRRRRRK